MGDQLVGIQQPTATTKGGALGGYEVQISSCPLLIVLLRLTVNPSYLWIGLSIPTLKHRYSDKVCVDRGDQVEEVIIAGTLTSTSSTDATSHHSCVVAGDVKAQIPSFSSALEWHAIVCVSRGSVSLFHKA